uniref:Cuticle protein 6 n=1 Tax=Strigamia maritima TaxID=126957 RepID=T1JIC1_STRMM
MDNSKHLHLLIIVSVFLLTSCQQPIPTKNKVPFVQQFIRGKDGSYGWSYFTIDGKTHYETRDNKGVVRGRYTYYDSLGHKVAVNYIADENGFRVLGGFQPGPPDESPQVVHVDNQKLLLF